MRGTLHISKGWRVLIALAGGFFPSPSSTISQIFDDIAFGLVVPFSIFGSQDESFISAFERVYFIANAGQRGHLNIFSAADKRHWTTTWLELCENLRQVLNEESGQAS
jgi:hypothetical protein